MTAKPSSPSLSRRGVIAAVPAVFLASCAALSGPPTMQLYILRPSVMAAAGARVRWQLTIAMPDCAGSLDTPRIALSRTAMTMDYYAGVSWSDRLPQLLQRTLVTSFEDSNRIPAVDRDTSGLETDYVLETEIRDFQARYDTPDGAPTVVVNIQAKLVKMPQRQIIGSLNASQQVPAGQNSVDSVVTAFNQAAGAALTQIVNWTISTPPA